MPELGHRWRGAHQSQPASLYCWASGRGMLQSNILAFNHGVPPQAGDGCCRTDILEALLLLGSLKSIILRLHWHHVTYRFSGKLQLIQIMLSQAQRLSQAPTRALSLHWPHPEYKAQGPCFHFPGTERPQPGAQRNN